jgi:hypothetical protein
MLIWNSLEYTIVVVNNTNSWDTVKTYKNIEYNIDLLFHLHKLDIITVKLGHTAWRIPPYAEILKS